MKSLNKKLSDRLLNEQFGSEEEGDHDFDVERSRLSELAPEMKVGGKNTRLVKDKATGEIGGQDIFFGDINTEPTYLSGGRFQMTRTKPC